MIGHPSNEHCTRIASRKDLKHCPIDVDNVKNAKGTFGPYPPGLKGCWSIRKTPTFVISESVHISREYYKLNKVVTIGAGVMIVAGVPFF